jgi:mono/diheme cytochrome c family protein
MFRNNVRKKLKACFEQSSNDVVCSNVEERRFSAASRLAGDAGFSPHGRISLTTRGVRISVVLLALILAFPLSTPAQKPASVTADLPAGPMQAKATTACLECHEARIILQQRLSKAAWTKEVDKMAKWGAVVDPADREALIDYLSTNFTPDTPAYQPQRTSPDKNRPPKTK